MSKEFRLKINNEMVNLSNIKGGIKREEFKDNQAMLNIFDALDKDGGQKDGVLSGSELTSFFGMVQHQAQKHKSTNLGDREYKHLLKDLKEKGIDLGKVSKDTFLSFIAGLDKASKKPATQEVVEEPKVEQENVSQDLVGDKDVGDVDDFTEAVLPQKPATLPKVSQPKAWKGASPTEALGNLNEQDDYNADKVLNKLMSTYDIKPEEVQMDKLKEDLIKYNPSIFDKDGNVYANVEWNKLDFPKNAGELYKTGVEPPKVEPRQPVNRKSAAGGGDNGGKGAGNTAVTQTFTTDDIKVTVPQTEQSKYAKLIDGYRKDGEKLHDSLKTGRTEGLTTNNIAYAFQKDIHFGPNSKGVAKKVFSLLYSRMAQLNLLEKGKDCRSYDRFSKMSFKEQDALLHNYRNRIVTKEREALRAENERVAKANARPAQQKMLDEANELLVNAANNAAKFKAEDFELDEDNNSIKLKLDDGKYIKANFNEVDGKILGIDIGHTNEDGDGVTDVYYYYNDKEKVYLVGNKYDLKVQGYEFGKMQEVAKAIFEKHIPVTPAIKPDENGQYSTDQVKFGVKYEYAKEDTVKRIQQAQAEGEKIRKGELGYDKLSVANAAYCFDDKSVEGHVKEVFGYLRARIRTIDKNKKLLTNEEFLSLSQKEQKTAIDMYANYIRNHEQKLLDKAQDKKKAEAKTNAQKFYEANKLLVNTANNPPQPDTITYSAGENNDGHRYAQVELEDGKAIRAYYKKSGSIDEIRIYHTEDNKKINDVAYNTKTLVGKKDKWVPIDYTGSYDRDKMFELARKIFGDWKEPPAEE